MLEARFLAALQAITAGRASLTDLIDAATAVAARADLAEQLYGVWVGFNRDHPQAFVAWFNRASLQTALGDLEAAATSLRAALGLNPDFHPAHINLGGLLERQGATDAAVAEWREVVDRLAAITGPAVEHKLTALKQIGRVLIDHHRWSLAEATLRESLAIRIEREVVEQAVALRMGQCAWPVFDVGEIAPASLLADASPLSLAASFDDPLLQLAAASRYLDKTVHAPLDAGADRRDTPIDLAGRRLRVGYVSSDLRDHAIGYLMAELFEVHDRARVEVFVYYSGPDPTGAHHERIRAAVEHWTDVTTLDDDAAARAIADDAIDVLVDVNGLTRFARTGVFARRPAPVQINWLGYPGSMGSPYHQYIIADDWIVPEGFEIFYSESVLRLPCYQPNDRRRAVDAGAPTRAQHGLPENVFVFCCFNGTQKITWSTFDAWLEILQAAPQSVLWLLEGGVESIANLRARAQAAGVGSERLIFAPKLANAHHLARYPLADVFLDTFPYGAHTTASDALWMGAPVLTVGGLSFASRVCGSLVRSAGLADLVCADRDAYVARAVALAADATAVAELKARLAASRDDCALFDVARLADALEALYRHACERHVAGTRLDPDLRNLRVYRAIGLARAQRGAESLSLADYLDAYKGELARLDRQRPLAHDARLWSPPEPPAPA